SHPFAALLTLTPLPAHYPPFLFFSSHADHRDLHSFPTRRSSDLARSGTRKGVRGCRPRDFRRASQGRVGRGLVMSAPFEILHLDNHLMVVNKPPGLLVQADRTGDTDLITLAKAYLKERFSKPGNVFVGLVHRLDRPASGVMVLARTSKAAARLSDQFRRHLPEKDYLAIEIGRAHV